MPSGRVVESLGYRFTIDYFAAGVDGESADVKVNSLHRPHGRSNIVDTPTFSLRDVSIRTTNVDAILINLNVSKTRVPWGMPELLTGLLLTVLITVIDSLGTWGSKRPVINLVYSSRRSRPYGMDPRQGSSYVRSDPSE